MYQDFLYEMENGLWYHFEFESDTVSVHDLRRFREYEASTSRRINGPVVTYVICSAKAKTIRDSITEGINTYRVRLIRLKDHDADSLFSRLSKGGGSSVKREDVIPMLLSPLMGGSTEQKERILHGIQFLRSAEGAFDLDEIKKNGSNTLRFRSKIFKRR